MNKEKYFQRNNELEEIMRLWMYRLDRLELNEETIQEAILNFIMPWVDLKIEKIKKFLEGSEYGDTIGDVQDFFEREENYKKIKNILDEQE